MTQPATIMLSDRELETIIETGIRRGWRLPAQKIASFRCELEERRERRREREAYRARLEKSETYETPALATLREARHALQSDRDELRSAESRLQRATAARREQEEIRFPEAQARFEIGEISEPEYSKQKTAYDLARATHLSAENDLRRLRRQVPVRSEQLQQARERAQEAAGSLLAEPLAKADRTLQVFLPAYAMLVEAEREVRASVPGSESQMPAPAAFLESLIPRLEDWQAEVRP